MLAQPTEAVPTAEPSPVGTEPTVGPGTRAVIAGLLVLTAMRVDLYAGVSLGTIMGIALAPAWLPRVRRFSGAAVFGGIVAACLASGVWLTALASTDHVIIERQVWAWAALMAGFVTTVGAILWARTVFADATVAVLFGIGMVAEVSPSDLALGNPWKSVLSIPLTVLLLGLAWMVRKRWLEVLFALLLAAVSAANDSRSHFAMLLVATALVVSQAWFRGGRRTGSTWRAVVVLACFAWAVYSLGQALVLDGYLGEETQARSAAQVETAGSILLGGRPEIGATVALMAERPVGFGIGTRPTVQEILVAKAGMTQLGYDPNNGYVERYMFGQLVELHSIIGDTWALFGVPGLVLCGFVAWTLLRRASTGLAARSLSALMAVLIVRIFWDLLFGPIYSSLPILALAVGLALHRGTTSRTREAPAPPGAAGRR